MLTLASTMVCQVPPTNGDPNMPLLLLGGRTSGLSPQEHPCSICKGSLHQTAQIFTTFGDFHRSVEIARFLPMNVPLQIAKPLPIPKTVSHLFLGDVLSTRRFPPIGGNRAIFTDEFLPSNRQAPVHSKKQYHIYFGRCSEHSAISTDRWKSRDFYR